MPRRYFAGRRGIESWEVAALLAERGNTYALRLEVFQRARDVEDALGSGAHDTHRRTAKLNQIGRNVHALFSAAMYAADTASDEVLDTDGVRKDHRASYSRSAIALQAEGSAQIPPGHLAALRARGVRELLKLRVRQADLHFAVHQCNRRGNDAVPPDNRLERRSSFRIRRIRHAMRDNCGLKSDDRCIGIQCVLNFLRQREATALLSAPSEGSASLPISPSRRRGRLHSGDGAYAPRGELGPTCRVLVVVGRRE